jgi:hypothetical protein
MTQLPHIDSRSASLAPVAPLTTLPTLLAERV